MFLTKFKCLVEHGHHRKWKPELRIRNQTVHCELDGHLHDQVNVVKRSQPEIDLHSFFTTYYKQVKVNQREIDLTRTFVSQLTSSNAHRKQINCKLSCGS